MNEEQFAKKIISRLQNEPDVSADVTARLNTARAMALAMRKNSLDRKLPEDVQESSSRTVTPTMERTLRMPRLDLYKSKLLWATSAVLSVVILAGLSIPLDPVNIDNDEISYHMDADDVEVLSDDI